MTTVTLWSRRDDGPGYYASRPRRPHTRVSRPTVFDGRVSVRPRNRVFCLFLFPAIFASYRYCWFRAYEPTADACLHNITYGCPARTYTTRRAVWGERERSETRGDEWFAFSCARPSPVFVWFVVGISDGTVYTNTPRARVFDALNWAAYNVCNTENRHVGPTTTTVFDVSPAEMYNTVWGRVSYTWLTWRIRR